MKGLELMSIKILLDTDIGSDIDDAVCLADPVTYGQLIAASLRVERVNG